MRLFALCVHCFCLAVTVCALTAQNQPTSYEIQVRIDPDQRHIEGRATIRRPPSARFYLHTNSKSTALRAPAKRLRLNVNRANKSSPTRFMADTLQPAVSQPVLQGHPQFRQPLCAGTQAPA